MHLIYMDESSRESRYQIVAATIIEDTTFYVAESYLRFVVEQYVPEELWDDFEFHAADLYHGNHPFEKIGRETALELFSRCASIVESERNPITIVYGAVDTRHLRAGIHATSSPPDVAFRLCIPEIERWFVEKAPDDIGIIIADDTTNQNHKKHMQASFRAHRCKIKVKVSHMEDGSLKEIEDDRGKLAHLHDDMYFGNSRDSIGIQLADIYCWMILRHLEGKEDTEFLYKRIERGIFSAKVEPPL